MKKVLLFGLLIGVLLTSSLLSASNTAETSTKLNIAITSPIAQLDPTAMDSNRVVRSNVCDALVEIGADGELTNGIASWEILDDGKCFEFTLREGIMFSSGDPLTAEDVEFTFTRQHTSPRAMPIDNFDRIEVVDDYTVRFYFTQYNCKFLHMAAGDAGFIITSKSYYDRVGEDEFRRNPVGTGPYKIVDWKEGDYVDLAANEYYWGEKPTVQQARFMYVPEPSTRVAMLRAGEVAMIVDTPWQDVVNLEEKGFIRKDCVVPHSQAVQFGLINPDTPWANLKVRQAINYAIDKEGLINSLFNGIPTIGVWLGPQELGYDPTLKPAYPYDLDKAKQLMEEAGYADGFKMPVYYLTNQIGAKDIADYLANTLMAINIDCKLTSMEFGMEYMNMVRDWHTDTTAELVVLGYAGTAYGNEPITGLQNHFYSKHFLSFYNRPDLDSIIDEIYVTVDDTKRGELYKQAYKIVDADLPIIPIIQIVSVYMTKPSIDYAVVPYGFLDTMVQLTNITIK